MERLFRITFVLGVGIVMCGGVNSAYITINTSGFSLEIFINQVVVFSSFRTETFPKSNDSNLIVWISEGL